MSGVPSLVRRSAILVAIALLASLGLSACATTSKSSFKGVQGEVAETITKFQSHVTSSNESALCEEDFARSVRQRLEKAGGTCLEAMKKQLKSVDEFTMTVKSIVVKGSSATATVKSTWSGQERQSKLLLSKEGSTWRISGLE